MAANLWNLENPVFVFYTICSAVLLFKTIFMSIWTGFIRISYKSFSWPEDNVHARVKEVKPVPHPEVERVRRCHQNDLENNIPFVLIGLLYTLTNPSVLTAKLLFSGFTVLRLIHTVVFMNQIRQPARFLVFLFALVINFIMLISVIIHVLPLVI